MALATVLVEGLTERPNDFYLTTYYLVDRKLELKYWIGSGSSYLSVTLDGGSHFEDEVAIGPCRTFKPFTIAGAWAWWHFRKWRHKEQFKHQHRAVTQIFENVEKKQ